MEDDVAINYYYSHDTGNMESEEYPTYDGNGLGDKRH